MSTKGQPFHFDQNVFDSDDPRAYEEKKPEKPEFTPTQLEEEKAKAFEDGKKVGARENEEGLTRSVLNVLQKLERDINVLFAAEEDRFARYESEAVHLTTSIMAKLFPAMNAVYGQNELEEAVLKILSKYKVPENISLEVHESLIDSMQRFLADKDVGKNIALKSDGALGRDQFRVRWPDGGMIVNRTEIKEHIVSLMKESLAERGVPVHDEIQEDDFPSPSEDNIEKESSDE